MGVHDMDKKVINELNAYLKGEYMAIKSYENYIGRIKDQFVKKEFREIQSDHKRHASRVSQRITELGGRPVKGPGLMGVMSSLKNLVKRNGNDTEFIIRDAGNGEYRGIRTAEEVVKGDLDADSLKLIKDILEEDRSHVGKLSNYLH
jgi:bacterioferritin